jgi:hypothetical protein
MKWLALMLGKLLEGAREARYPREKMQEPKRQSRFTYTDGPMFFLGLQIVKAMQDAGYPAKIHECYRPPERQDALFAKGKSKARAWSSPHQFLEAVDIIHPSKGWNVSDEYWDTLHACATIVEEKFGVEFEHGYDWGWDKAHIELKDWRVMRERIKRASGAKMRNPYPAELWQRFKEVLPSVAKQHMRSPRFEEPGT